MTPPATLSHGLPGKITETSLSLPATLTLEEWAKAIRLLGRMAHGIQWWLSDALVHGDEHYGEKMAAYADETGLAPQTIQNLLWVGKAVPRSRRRESLSFSHHEAVAALSPAVQEVWLEKAERGESLPGGGSQRWSVTRLRAELRAIKPKKEVAHDTGGSGVPDRGPRPRPAVDLPVAEEVVVAASDLPNLWEGQTLPCAIALGSLLEIPNFGPARVTAISLGPVAAFVTLVHAK
jgi:hypothetical protein